MSYVDDHYEDMMMEKETMNEAIAFYVKHYPAQKVVNDALFSFRNEEVDELDILEKKSRDIIKTIARTKNVSLKQKTVLVRLLVYRCDDDYEN